jgi:hypothetical protein
MTLQEALHKKFPYARYFAPPESLQQQQQPAKQNSVEIKED